jgi:hypothetical protein
MNKFINGLNSSFESNYFENKKTIILIDQILATFIHSIFFLVGTISNFVFVCIHFRKLQTRYFIVKGSSGDNSSDASGKKRRSIYIRVKNKANNHVVLMFSIANLILCSIFIPYTIVFRILDFQLSASLAKKIIEHLKDSLIYMNLFFMVIIAYERYIAICKPHKYKFLESKINKIIWVLYLLALCLSSTNYLVEHKSDLGYVKSPTNNFTSANQSIHDFKPRTQALCYSDFNNIYLKVNLIVASLLLFLSALISTIFYINICFDQHFNNQKKSNVTKHKNLEILEIDRSCLRRKSIIIEKNLSSLTKENTLIMLNSNNDSLSNSKNDDTIDISVESNLIRLGPLEMKSANVTKLNVSVQTESSTINDFKVNKNSKKSLSAASSAKLITKICIFVSYGFRISF